MKKLNFKLKKFNIKSKKAILSISVILILVALAIAVPITVRQNKLQNEQKQFWEAKLVGQYWKDIKFQYLITVYDADGLEYVKTPKDYNDTESANGNVIYCSGKQTVSFDYEVLGDKDYVFKIKVRGETEERTEHLIKNNSNNYTCVNGTYANAPDLTGYNQDRTRYLRLVDNNGNLVKGENDGNLVPSTWIKEPIEDKDWYSYGDQNWANIYVESNGIESYYVWIPRYCYKLNQTEQRSEVRFINDSNEYKYLDGTEEKTITWEELKADGWQIPEAFAWNENRIAGYWMSKYQLSELTNSDTYTVDYSMVATIDSMIFQNIKLNTGNKTVSKIQYYIDGKLVHEVNSQTPEDYEQTGLQLGERTINVTALDANGEIIGSMTKDFEVAEPNAPQLAAENGAKAFDPDTTFYVYWDNDNNEHNEIPISKPAPIATSENKVGWYNYTIARWANIVTRNDGLETYLVWIPRYAYKLDQTSQRSYVKFLKGTSSDCPSGYKIPEAFWWDKNGDGQRTADEELPGYWMTKYQLSIEEKNPKMNAELSAASNIIRVNDITGTLIDAAKENNISVSYEYYIDGDLKHTGTASNEHYIFEGLGSNRTYTVNIIARNSKTNEYIGATTKKVTTTDANAPDTSAFNQSQTYYVTYDENENEQLLVLQGNTPPNNWYDYSNQRWANIVTIANGTRTYFTWIPRYEYKIVEDRANLDTSNRRIDVTFLRGTTNTADTGYKIPEAFTFGGKELTGYWITKYQLTDKNL